MKQLFMFGLIGLSLAATACDNKKDKPATPTTYEADNTGINVRDRDTNAVLPTNQSEKESDILITKNIRKALIDDASLSTDAKNIKIITIDGVVKLRGPVKSQAERDNIQRKASGVSGVASVDNQLDVTSK